MRERLRLCQVVLTVADSAKASAVTGGVFSSWRAGAICRSPPAVMFILLRIVIGFFSFNRQWYLTPVWVSRGDRTALHRTAILIATLVEINLTQLS